MRPRGCALCAKPDKGAGLDVRSGPDGHCQARCPAASLTTHPASYQEGASCLLTEAAQRETTSSSSRHPAPAPRLCPTHQLQLGPQAFQDPMGCLGLLLQ